MTEAPAVLKGRIESALRSRAAQLGVDLPGVAFDHLADQAMTRLGWDGQRHLHDFERFRPGEWDGVLLGLATLSAGDVQRPIPTRDVAYLNVIPTEILDGRFVVHNTVRPTRRLGSRGFRAWLAPLDDGLVACGCAWAPELGTHYRVAGDSDAGVAS